MTALTRFLRRRREKDYKNGEQQSKLYRTITNVAIIGTFLACGILVLALFKMFTMTSTIFGIVATIAIVSIACLMLLPWIRIYEKGEFKKTAIVFMIFIAVCSVLWLICIYMGIGIYNKARDKVDLSQESFISTLNFIKITLIVSLQFLVASLIGNTIVKYRKSMVIFQAITYLSNLYFDFYATFFLTCLKITPEKGLEISDSISLLGNKFVLMIFVLSVLYMIISSAIMKRMESRRFINAVEDGYNMDGTRKESDEETFENEEKTVQSSEEKLESLKNMLDKNLISQEEYDKKKEEILKDM